MRNIKLPNGWKRCRLNEVFVITIGGTPSRKVEEYWGGEYNWVAISDLVSKYISKTKEKITELAIKKSNVKLIPKGSVILSFKLSIGKVAISAVDLFTNEAIAALIPKHNNTLIPEYVYYFLKNTDLTCYGQKAVKGVCLNKSILNDIEIIVPTLEAQKKIVEVLEKAEKAIEKRKESIKLLDELVKSRFIEMFGDPKDNIKGWEVKKLGEIFKVGSSRRIYQNEQTLSGVPFLRISNLVQRIETGSNSSELYISEEQYNLFKEKALVPLPGDILVTSRGTLGLCYIVQESDRFYFQDGMISWLKRGNTDVNSIYIKNLFGMKGFQKQIDEIPTGTTVNYLSISRLADLDVMYPNIGLQNQFAAFVNQVDKLKFEMEKSLKELGDNFNSLMQKAFKGELFH